MIFSLPAGKLENLFKLIDSKMNLYIPVKNNTGKTDFQKWIEGAELSKDLRTVRSVKEFFFPKTEELASIKMSGKSVTVEDTRTEIQDFVVFGVRACDFESIKIIDDVYLNMEPVDTYYKNRRDHGLIITLSCPEPAQTCFCHAYGIDAAEPKGDISAWLIDNVFYFKSVTEKGFSLLDSIKSLLSTTDEKVIEKEQEIIREKMKNTPFADLDLSKWVGKDMLKIFNSNLWENLSQTCLGCGTCTYVCPTCMCFDIKDFEDGCKVKKFRCWDSCMYSDFTQMAAENPRTSQKQRFRQRFMHKLIYYPMAHDDHFQCVGCGRCLESCPINMNIVKVIKTYNELTETAEEGAANGN